MEPGLSKPNAATKTLIYHFCWKGWFTVIINIFKKSLSLKSILLIFLSFTSSLDLRICRWQVWILTAQPNKNWPESVVLEFSVKTGQGLVWQKMYGNTATTDFQLGLLVLLVTNIVHFRQLWIYMYPAYGFYI